MDCEEIRLNLLAYLDGEVTGTERAEIEAHLPICADCTAELERLQALQADLWDAIPAGLEQLRLPASAEERIRARLHRALPRHSTAPRHSWLDGLAGLFRPRPALLKVAIPLIVALFFIAAGLVGRRPAPVRAQETLVYAPQTLVSDTDAALRVIVRESASAQPIPGADIEVHLRPRGKAGALVYSGRTGSQGTANVRFRVPEIGEEDRLAADLVVTALSPLGQDVVEQEVEVKRSFYLLLSSDKPLYQPGQKIHMRSLALDAAHGLPATGREVTFTVQGTGGQVLFERTVFTSAYGIASADVVLDAGVAHDIYRLVATLGDTRSERTVTVGPYVRPRFHVELDLSAPYYLAGETVEGEVAARTFYEQPLAGAPVTVRAYLHDPDRRLVATVQGRTDDAGLSRFRFGLPAALATGQANLAVEASVADAENHAEWAGRVVPVAGEPLVVDVVAEGGRLRPGVENTIYVLVSTPDGAPVRAHLQVDVAGQRFELDTDQYGLAEFGLTPDPGVRQVQVQILARDAEGRTVTHAASLSADQGPAQVLLRLDRAAYQVREGAAGEVMHMEVLAGQGEAVYVDVVHRGKGQTISTHVAPLSDGRATLDLDVSPHMAGTLEVHAYQVLPDGTLARDARLAVVDAASEVTIDVRADKSAYPPGDVAHVALDTEIDGRPVQAALGIAVVDESIFALEERAPGFAKLFFILEESLIASTAQPVGTSLAELLDPGDLAGVRAAQDQAARAAWARLPADALSAAGRLSVAHSTPSDAMAAAIVAARARLRWLAGGLGITWLLLALGLWVAVVFRLRRAGSWTAALWRPALLLIGLSVLFLIPLTALLSLGLALALGETAGKVLLALLLVAWLAALVVLGVYAWSRRDDGAQIAVLLVAACGLLGALLGIVAGRGGDPGLGLALGVTLAYLAALLALLLLAAGFWLERRRLLAGATLALALLSVAAVLLAGVIWSQSSSFARTIADPHVYIGPTGWLMGCASKTAIVEKETEKAIEETVVVEKEVEKVVKETVIAEVEKEVTQIVEVEKGIATTPTVARTATPPAATAPVPKEPAAEEPQATPAPPAQPAEPPAAEPTSVAELPLPLLGQVAAETIYWAPEALTAEDGHLEIVVPLPDVPTTWRLTALASTRNGELGSATAPLLVLP
jgi:anti-sigma factor RsiW